MRISASVPARCGVNTASITSSPLEGFRSYCSIARMPEVIGTFSSTEAWQERANRSPKTRTSSLDGAQKCFELAEGHLDRIEVGRILGQVAKGRRCILDRLTYARAFVCADIVHHDDIAALGPRTRIASLDGCSHGCIARLVIDASAGQAGSYPAPEFGASHRHKTPKPFSGGAM